MGYTSATGSGLTSTRPEVCDVCGMTHPHENITMPQHDDFKHTDVEKLGSLSTNYYLDPSAEQLLIDTCTVTKVHAICKYCLDTLIEMTVILTEAQELLIQNQLKTHLILMKGR